MSLFFVLFLFFFLISTEQFSFIQKLKINFEIAEKKENWFLNTEILFYYKMFLLKKFSNKS
jgi:hypothetical protein